MSYPVVKLGDIADFIRGITFKPDDVVPLDADDAVVCMRTKNVQTLLECDDLLAVPSQFVRRKDQYLQEGDILVSSANSWNLVGKCCWIPSLPWRAAFGGFISVLRGDSARVDRRYLYWWFASGKVQALLRSFGQKTTNISNLNIDRCLQLDLPLPALPEQRRIAAILDQADALRAKRREALAQLDRLAQSVFIEMFGDPVENPKGWDFIQFGDGIASDLRNGLSPSTNGKVTAKVLTLSAITGSNFNQNAWKFAPFQVAPPNHQSVDLNDLLICRGNGNVKLVGKAYFPKRSLTDVTFPDTIIAARINKHFINREYLEFIWNAKAVRVQIEAVARTTNGTFKINQSMLEGIQIMLPPIPLQKTFATRIQSIESLKARHRTALADLDALFASLQHRAFLGDL